VATLEDSSRAFKQKLVAWALVDHRVLQAVLEQEVSCSHQTSVAMALAMLVMACFRSLLISETCSRQTPVRTLQAVATPEDSSWAFMQKLVDWALVDHRVLQAVLEQEVSCSHQTSVAMVLAMLALQMRFSVLVQSTIRVVFLELVGELQHSAGHKQ